jgi:hypothetical protein
MLKTEVPDYPKINSEATKIHHFKRSYLSAHFVFASLTIGSLTHERWQWF